MISSSLKCFLNLMLNTNNEDVVLSIIVICAYGPTAHMRRSEEDLEESVLSIGVLEFELRASGLCRKSFAAKPSPLLFYSHTVVFLGWP